MKKTCTSIPKKIPAVFIIIIDLMWHEPKERKIKANERKQKEMKKRKMKRKLTSTLEKLSSGI
jgi:hypothetical protein